MPLLPDPWHPEDYGVDPRMVVDCVTVEPCYALQWGHMPFRWYVRLTPEEQCELATTHVVFKELLFFSAETDSNNQVQVTAATKQRMAFCLEEKGTT